MKRANRRPVHDAVPATPQAVVAAEPLSRAGIVRGEAAARTSVSAIRSFRRPTSGQRLDRTDAVP